MSTPTFAALGVPAPIAARLEARGITTPFPIQAATLVDALAGRDVCGKAPTGSGKTLAFGIPLVHRTARSKPRHPRGLVLVPTRELANQVREELVELAGPEGPSVTVIYGGVGFGAQINALRKGTDIVVACPGRLADLVNRNELVLDQVETVVLDEADRMADMGFLPEVRRLLDRVRPDRQTLLFSATLDGDIDVLIKHYQRTPARHEVVAEDDAPQSTHIFWRSERTDRIELTAAIVNAEWPAVVFCRTKHGADRLAKQLGKQGVAAVAIHGDRSQAQRERALAAFSSGKAQALVATDVAARGIHVDDVACVVHYDPPADEKDYVHRSGRTGRAGAAGIVVSLVGGEQMKGVKLMQRRLGLRPGIDDPDMTRLSSEVRPSPGPIVHEPTPENPHRVPRTGRPGPGAPQSRRRPQPAGRVGGGKGSGGKGSGGKPAGAKSPFGGRAPARRSGR